MTYFRPILEVLKYSSPSEALSEFACVSAAWSQASNNSEVWDCYIEDYRYLPRTDCNGKHWFRQCCRYRAIPLIQGKWLFLISVPSLHITSLTLATAPLVNESSSFCFLTPTKLISCGGTTHSRVYEIDIESLKVAEKPPMNYARKAPGVISLLGEVFAIGGSVGGEPMDSAERLRVGNGLWTIVKGVLQYARANFTPVAHRQEIVCIGHCETVEVLDVHTEEFRLLEIVIPPLESMTVSSLFRSELLILRGKGVYRALLDPQPAVVDRVESQYKYSSFWSSSAPVYYGSHLFLVCSVNSPIAILRVNWKTLEAVEVMSLRGR